MRSVLFCLVAVAAAQINEFEDISKFETFTPKLVSQTFAFRGDKYPSHLEVAVKYQEQDLFLVLDVNTELFAEDWSLIQYNDAGEVVFSSNNSADYNCHYLGVVKGVENSQVVMSICDEIGMRGTIQTEQFYVETQHAMPLNQYNGARGMKRSIHGELHIIYSLSDVAVRGQLEADLANAADTAESTDESVNAAYNCRAVIASDSFRMNAFGSGGAESQNTQSVMNQVNSRYRNTQWLGGHTVSTTIGQQVQNPSGWQHSSNMNTKLSALSTYKRNSHPNRHNVPGFTHFNYGGTVGLAWVGTMCQVANSCGVNNVGFTSSDSTRGVLVAHEMGHNFNFQHDSGDRGFVMWPSVVASASAFSPLSRRAFDSSRGRFGCLL